MKLIKKWTVFIWLAIVLLVPIAGYAVAYAGWRDVAYLLTLVGLLIGVGVLFVLTWSTT